MGATIVGTLVMAFITIAAVRLAGRKSISHMNATQIAILSLAITVLGAGLANAGWWNAIVASAILIAILVGMEWISVKSNRVEKALKGTAVPVIRNGELLLDNLKKLRITVDELEKRMRMLGLKSFADIKFGTIEDNGALGFELFPSARSVTVADLSRILRNSFPNLTIPPELDIHKDDIFKEVMNESRQPQPDVPRHLQ